MSGPVDVALVEGERDKTKGHETVGTHESAEPENDFAPSGVVDTIHQIAGSSIERITEIP
jgi:hypothetical protein